MNYEQPKMLISMFDDEDDILTESGVATQSLDEGYSSAADAAKGDTNGSDATYSVDVKTFN